MRKKNRIAVKLLLLLLALLFLGIVFLVGRNADSEEYSENQVSVAEVKSELSFGVYENEDWDSFFAAYHKDSLTSDMLADLLEKLELTDYIELPGMTGRHTVTRDEWNLAYSQILDLLDMEQLVQKKTLLLLDVMEAKGGRVLITNAGDYYTTLFDTCFEKWNGYELYCTDDRCLGIVGISAQELSVENAYLTKVSEGEITFLYSGASYQKEIGGMGQEAAEGVCDLVFSGGSLVSLRMKQEIIQGALLSYDDTSIEIEDYGKIAHPGKIPVYQTYGEVEEKSLSDVILGNMQVEYVTGENQVCAILIRQPAKICNIRVLLLADDGGNTREAVYLKCDTASAMKCGDWEEQVEAGKVIPASEFLSADPSRTRVSLSLPRKRAGRLRSVMRTVRQYRTATRAVLRCVREAGGIRSSMISRSRRICARWFRAKCRQPMRRKH